MLAIFDSGATKVIKVSLGIAFLKLPPTIDEILILFSVATCFKKRKAILLELPRPRGISIPE